MNLSAAELHLIREALTLANGILRYEGTTFGPEYQRALSMSILNTRIMDALDTLTLPVEIGG